MSAWVTIDRFRGLPSVVLSSDRADVTFLPSTGMLGASLRLDGEEYLALPGGTAGFVGGHTTGLPLLHPWANRLSADGFQSGRVDVSLAGDTAVHRDPNGLPIHGTMVGARVWDILELQANAKRARLRAEYRYGDHDGAELAAFPFPHVVHVEATLKGQSLRVRTAVEPTAKTRVPISFGWHPYFRIPRAPRRAWKLRLPKRAHLELDERGIPSGSSTPEKAENEVVGERTFDDSYAARGKPPWTFGLEAGDRRLTLEMDEGYPYSQVYVPESKPFVAIEPMTAPVDALVTQDALRLKPGSAYWATFTIELSRLAKAPTDAPDGEDLAGPAGGEVASS